MHYPKLKTFQHIGHHQCPCKIKQFFQLNPQIKKYELSVYGGDNYASSATSKVLEHCINVVEEIFIEFYHLEDLVKMIDTLQPLQQNHFNLKRLKISLSDDNIHPNINNFEALSPVLEALRMSTAETLFSVFIKYPFEN